MIKKDFLTISTRHCEIKQLLPKPNLKLPWHFRAYWNKATVQCMTIESSTQMNNSCLMTRCQIQSFPVIICICY